ncbi:TIR domain-containing protein [Nocardioides pacificus]
MADKKKVFISWSGDYTKAVAIILKEWLEELFDQVETFVSDRDIEAGARSLSVIEGQLKDTSFGMILVTPENMGSQWINFEAGALSKEVADSDARVVPVLFGQLDTPAKLTGPLAQFQAKVFDKQMLDVLSTLGRLLGVKEDVVKRRYDRTWEDVNKRVAAIEVKEKAADSSEESVRPVEDMVEETLTIVRELRRRTVGTRARTGMTLKEFGDRADNFLKRMGVESKTATDHEGRLVFELHGPTQEEETQFKAFIVEQADKYQLEGLFRIDVTPF